MKLSLFGRLTLASIAALALGLGMTACGGGTIAYLWVPGQQYNQIAGFKVDDYTGNLTTSPNSPYSASSNPITMLISPTGRFAYVINRGTGGDPTVGNPVPTRAVSSGIDLYTVGNDGVLNFQQHYDTQGFVPVWAQISGAYLYSVDKYSPGATAAGACPTANAATCYGSITAYQIDQNTGRLILVLNQQVKDPNTGLQLTYFNVGGDPIMSKLTGTCLFTVDAADNTVFPYAIGGSGQLTIVTTGVISTGATQLTSINGNGSSVYLTDANLGSATNYILPYTIGSGCTLNLLTGGAVTNFVGTSNPTYSLLDNTGKFLYVLNQTTLPGPGGTTPFSSISAFVLQPGTGQLTEIAGAPYTVGSGPVCVVEDPTNQYLYVSNHNDGTVTGKLINSSTGELSDLTRGSTFFATGQPTCLALSGNVNY